MIGPWIHEVARLRHEDLLAGAERRRRAGSVAAARGRREDKERHEQHEAPKREARAHGACGLSSTP